MRCSASQSRFFCFPTLFGQRRLQRAHRSQQIYSSPIFQPHNASRPEKIFTSRDRLKYWNFISPILLDLLSSLCRFFFCHSIFRCLCWWFCILQLIGFSIYGGVASSKKTTYRRLQRCGPGLCQCFSCFPSSGMTSLI